MHCLLVVAMDRKCGISMLRVIVIDLLRPLIHESHVNLDSDALSKLSQLKSVRADHSIEIWSRGPNLKKSQDAFCVLRKKVKPFAYCDNSQQWHGTVKLYAD